MYVMYNQLQKLELMRLSLKVAAYLQYITTFNKIEKKDTCEIHMQVLYITYYYIHYIDPEIQYLLGCCLGQRTGC